MVNYKCNYCNYKTCNKADYNKHLKTKKHAKNATKEKESYKSENSLFQLIPKSSKKNQCEYCEKTYSTPYNLTKHLKKCKKVPYNSEFSTDTENSSKSTLKSYTSAKNELKNIKKVIKVTTKLTPEKNSTNKKDNSNENINQDNTSQTPHGHLTNIKSKKNRSKHISLQKSSDTPQLSSKTLNNSEDKSKFQCSFCDKKYTRKDNMKRHEDKCENTTLKKEQKNRDIMQDTSHRKYTDNTPIISKFLCQYCNCEYSRMDAMKRHEVKCSKRIDKIEEMKMKNNLKLAKNSVEHEREKAEFYKQQMIYYKYMFEQAGMVTQQVMSAFRYMVHNFGDAPELRPIGFEEIKKIGYYDTDNEIMDIIFSRYKNKVLHKFIGDILVKAYKKKDPKDQGLWATDSSRMTYAIKRLIDSSTSKWIVDKKGVDTTKLIIEPVLNKIKVLSTIYHEKECFDNPNTSADRIMMINEIYVLMVNDIDNKKIHDDVLKYISPYFRLEIDKTQKLEAPTLEMLMDA